jgi:hypothetical protein
MKHIFTFVSVSTILTEILQFPWYCVPCYKDKNNIIYVYVVYLMTLSVVQTTPCQEK